MCLKMCESCPWNETESSIQAQNYGCLPTPSQMVESNDEGVALSCHDDESSVCRGLASHLKDVGAKPGKLKTYSDWYRNG